MDEALKGEFHSQTITARGEDYYVVSAPMDIIYCYFMLVIPTDTMRKPVVELTDHISASTMESLEAVQKIMADTGNNLLIFVLILIVVGTLIGNKVSSSIVKPIQALTDMVKNTVDDNFEFKWTMHSGDETDILGQSFEEMTKRLKEYIANLTRMTSEKERIETELSVASQIQSGMLSKNFELFYRFPQVELFASMNAAKEVGGNFYDFFRIDNKHIGLVIGDVSGKGVPAALFMAMALTCLKDMANLGLAPAQIMERANNILNENNTNMFFVTVWLGILDTETGVIDFVNAGHNPPIIYKKNKGFTYLRCEPNIIMAIFPDRKYVQEQLILAPDEMLLLYTDGVTEATNGMGLQYGEERLMQHLEFQKIYDAKAVIESISRELSEFQGDAEQFDDITMLALKYGAKDEHTL